MIRVDRLRKEFKVSRKMRKELGAGAPLGKTLTAVDGISFECRPGRVFGLLGPNGAGKTTALRLIATMLKPTSGTITVAGADAEREPQRVRSAIGFMTGNTGLYDRLTVTEMTWEAWEERHPDTEVVSSETEWDRNYKEYPYGSYEDLDNPPFFAQEYDRSRQPKERVMGIEGRDGGLLALPFLELDQLGTRGVVNTVVDGDPFLVVWDRQDQSAVTFSRIPENAAGVSGEQLTFSVETETGKIFDNETGSEWTLTGRAVAGELTGFVLPGHPEAMVAFWFAWSAFHPNTAVWIAN